MILATGIGFTTVGLTKSSLTGPAGNIEFLALLRCDPEAALPDAQMIELALAEE